MPSIAVRYCGGCNPAYQRVALVEQIKKELAARGQDILWLPPGQAADVLLMVCGCMAMCIAAEINASPAPVTYLIGPDHLNYASCPQPRIVRLVVESICQRFAKIVNLGEAKNSAK
jgi:hypothetical protein